MTDVLIYACGWLLFVAGQAQNSVLSTANGLHGWSGFFFWLKKQVVNLAFRAFLSGLFYDWLIQYVATKVSAAGLPLHAHAVAGLAGIAANALLYQIFGLLPWLRVEVQDLAPPSNDSGKGKTP